MRRRDLVAVIGIAFGLYTVAARAGQAGLPIIGVLLPNYLDKTFEVFPDALRKLGYEDGRNVRLVIRSADAKLDALPALAEELVAMKPAVIVSINTPPTHAAVQATKDIPIVFAIVGDPVGTGFVSNLAHPAGNVTGFSNQGTDIAAKRLQLLKEVASTVRKVAILYNPDDPVTTPQRRQVEPAASQVGVEARFFPVNNQDALSQALGQLGGWADALQWLGGQEYVFIPGTIEFAAKHRLPTMVPRRQEVQDGALICYNADIGEQYRGAATYVVKILNGERPGDLPVVEPTRVELVVNANTAKALGMTLPQSILARAEEVIE